MPYALFDNWNHQFLAEETASKRTPAPPTVDSKTEPFVQKSVQIGKAVGSEVQMQSTQWGYIMLEDCVLCIIPLHTLQDGRAAGIADMFPSI